MKRLQTILVGDIIGSRKQVGARQWDRFEQVINSLNHEYQDSIKIPLTIYSGDSFGMVAKNLQASFPILQGLYHKLGGKVRIALVKDEVSYGMEKGNFLHLEGPALWKANDIVEKLKTEKLPFGISLPDVSKAQLIDILYNLLLGISSQWTDKQFIILEMYQKGQTQMEIAKELKVTQQLISKQLQNANFKLYDRTLQYLTDLWK